MTAIVARKNEDRRFTDKPELRPGDVRSLPIRHPALVENRTLFPSTVVDVNEDFTGNVLVSGKHNRKLGERVAKGAFKNYALYGLSLEERATCPADCSARAFCYGNGMQMARRHRIGNLDVFNGFLENEIKTILADPIDGLLVRLHVLGDFPSVDYVAMWADLLDSHEKLACYGYTHWDFPVPIAAAIGGLKARFPDRFRIRWSRRTPSADAAVVIDYVPTTTRVKAGIVCPAQTDATACCATCGLCWEGHAKKDTILFIKHGPKSLSAQGESRATSVDTVRPITALKIPGRLDEIMAAPPLIRIVDPSTLKVEPEYQRDLSSKSMRLIRKIVTSWDWTKFKPPICAETPSGLFIIDGQHTAIAAASHPTITEIPVMVVGAEQVALRAKAFVAHNRDRLTMTPAQIFYGDVAAGDAKAIAVNRAIVGAGGSVPRLPVQKRYAKPGDVSAIGELRTIHGRHGDEIVDRIVRIAVIAKATPLSLTVARCLEMILTEKLFEHVAKRPSDAIAAGLAAVKNIESASQHYAAETGQSRFRAAAMLIAKQIEG